MLPVQGILQCPSPAKETWRAFIFVYIVLLICCLYVGSLYYGTKELASVGVYLKQAVQYSYPAGTASAGTSPKEQDWVVHSEEELLQALRQVAEVYPVDAMCGSQHMFSIQAVFVKPAQ